MLGAGRFVYLRLPESLAIDLEAHAALRERARGHVDSSEARGAAHSLAGGDGTSSSSQVTSR